MSCYLLTPSLSAGRLTDTWNYRSRIMNDVQDVSCSFTSKTAAGTFCEGLHNKLSYTTEAVFVVAVVDFRETHTWKLSSFQHNLVPCVSLLPVPLKVTDHSHICWELKLWVPSLDSRAGQYHAGDWQAIWDKGNLFVAFTLEDP